MKVSEIRERTDEELVRLSNQLHSELFALRVKKATNQLEDTASLKQLRLDIARVETIRRAREKGVEESRGEV
jgi:large subunit ribosomal protein L29